MRASERQLSMWERNGLIQASHVPEFTPSNRTARNDKLRHVGQDQQPRYTFADVSALKSLLKLRQGGISLKQLRSFHEKLRTGLSSAAVSRAWNDLQIQTHGKRISVSYQGRRMEPLTGQLLLEFSSLREQPRLRRIDTAPQHHRSREAERRARADRLFLAGLRYEEQPETIVKAIRAYRKATELNPRAVGAFINLGTIHYHQGSLEEAEKYYRAALALNPGSALVHFNLGNLLEEQGRWEAAQSYYEEAIRLDSRYPDPRFNLAMIYERLGRHGKACQQWRAYLKLDSESRWAAYAREKLSQIPLRVVPSKKPRNEQC
jgi:tetratricopeptide (TPR) repeat protein